MCTLPKSYSDIEVCMIWNNRYNNKDSREIEKKKLSESVSYKFAEIFERKCM